MSKGPLSPQDLADIVDWEGLAYAITGYLGPNIDVRGEKAKELQEHWSEAYHHLDQIRRLLPEPEIY